MKQEVLTIRIEKRLCDYLQAIAREEEKTRSSIARSCLIDFINQYRYLTDYVLDEEIFD